MTAGEDYNGALQLAREAVAGNPDNMWYKILLANILQKKAMIEEAKKGIADGSITVEGAIGKEQSEIKAEIEELLAK